MKIKDIISEGWWDVAKRLTKDIAGGDVNVGADLEKLSQWTGGKVKPAAGPGVYAAPAAEQRLNPGEIFVVKHKNGEQYFKDASNRWWWNVGALPNQYNASQLVKRPEDVNQLNMIPASKGRVLAVKPDAPGSTTFVPTKQPAGKAGRQSLKQQMQQKGIRGR